MEISEPPSLPPVTIGLCGDVMTGRGVDQVLPCPSDPALHEPWVSDARQYVELAEQVNGPIPKPVDFTYVWGDVLDFASIDPSTGRLVHLDMTPTQIRRMRIQHAEKPDVLWLQDVLNRESRKFGTRVELTENDRLALA